MKSIFSWALSWSFAWKGWSVLSVNSSEVRWPILCLKLNFCAECQGYFNTPPTIPCWCPNVTLKAWEILPVWSSLQWEETHENFYIKPRVLRLIILIVVRWYWVIDITLIQASVQKLKWLKYFTPQSSVSLRSQNNVPLIVFKQCTKLTVWNAITCICYIVVLYRLQQTNWIVNANLQ